MNILESIYPGDACASFILRVMAEVTLVTLAAIVFTRLVGKNNPAMRHGVCICALLCVLAAPLSTLGLERLGWRTFQITLERQHAGPASRALPHRIERFDVQSAAVEPFWTLERARSGASLLLLVWVGGLGFLLVRLTAGVRKVARLRRSAREIRHPKLDAALDSLLAFEDLPNTPIRFSARTHSPVVVGPRNPTVILPEKLLHSLDERQLRCVLAHELAHVRQRDPLIGLIQRLVEASYWPHPLVHLLNRDLVRAREEVCDNVALRGTTPPQYADTLLTVALGITLTQPLPNAVGFMTRPWRLEERVKGLLDPHRRLTTTMNTRYIALMGIALASGAALIAGAHIEASPYPPSLTDTLDLYSHYNAKTHSVVVTHKLKKQSVARKGQTMVLTYHPTTTARARTMEPYQLRLVSPTAAVPPRQLVLEATVAPPVPPRPTTIDVSPVPPVPAVAPSAPSASAPSAVPAPGQVVLDLRTQVDPPAPAAPPTPIKGQATLDLRSSSQIVAPAPLRIGESVVTRSAETQPMTLKTLEDGKGVVIEYVQAPKPAAARARIGQSTPIAIPSDRVHSTTIVGAPKPSQEYQTITVPGRALAIQGDAVTTIAATPRPMFRLQAEPVKPGEFVYKLRPEVKSEDYTVQYKPATPAVKHFISYLAVPRKVETEKVTTVYIDGEHVKVVGGKINVVYVHSKPSRAKPKAKTKN